MEIVAAIASFWEITRPVAVALAAYLAWGTDLFWDAEIRQRVQANPDDYQFPRWFHRFY